jgi:hypothetical protein
MTELEEALHRGNEIIVEEIRQCGSVPEGKWDLNDSNRDVIQAMWKLHGTCWLGIINRYEEGPWIWEWDGGMVYNFGCAFVLPAYDAELERMLRERHQAGYQRAPKDWKSCEAISERIQALGGHHFVWS